MVLIKRSEIGRGGYAGGAHLLFHSAFFPSSRHVDLQAEVMSVFPVLSCALQRLCGFRS